MRKRALTLIAGISLLGSGLAVEASTPLNAIISADDPAGNMGGARVRVVHASPDAPAVDVWVDGGIVFESVAFEDITAFVEVPAGTYNVQVVPAGETSPVVIEADLPLDAGIDYTVVATDLLATITPVILTADGGSPAAGNAWVRFLHASPDAPPVDIAVAGGPVLLDDVAFQESTDYLPVPAGTYDLEARVAGTQDVALSIPGVTVDEGGVYTAYATGLLSDVPSADLDTFSFALGVARTEGAEGSFFVTDMVLNNLDDTTATYQFLWLPRDEDNSEPTGSDTFTLGPGMSARYDDILGAVFGVTDDMSAAGAVAVLSDTDKLIGFARTFNVSDEGTYGQAIPLVPSGELIPAGFIGRILFFTENADYRSNIAILNGTGEPMTVRWARYLGDGTLVEGASADLPPWGNVQLNRVFQNEAPVEAAYIDVWTETPDARFIALGSVLDNMTSDPTTVLPQ